MPPCDAASVQHFYSFYLDCQQYFLVEPAPNLKILTGYSSGHVEGKIILLSYQNLNELIPEQRSALVGKAAHRP